MAKADMRIWKSYPGFLDIATKYKVKAWLLSHVPFAERSARKFVRRHIDSLFPYKSKNIRALENGDMPLVAQIRNARRFLPSFLHHYRTLGVTRFIFVDDGSTDGSLDYLEHHPDVDLYQSPLSYMESNRGLLFKEEIVRRYGANRWWVFVDIDEYLVYDGIEKHNLCDLANALKKRGLKRLLAPLLDMYPIGDPQDAHFDGSNTAMPWTVAQGFDRSGYSIQFRGKDWEIRGGVRHRLFGNWVELAKYPLMYVSDGDYFRSIHYPRPYYGNCVPVLGNLLHFKFFDDFEQSIKKAAAEGRYFEGSKHYKIAAERIDKERIEFYSEGITEVYKTPHHLKELGFFKSLFTDSNY